MSRPQSACKRYWLAAAITLGLLCIPTSLVIHRLGGYAFLSLRFSEWLDLGEFPSAIWLPDYRVVVEAHPIAGLADDLSALTFDPDRKTLFSVTNSPPQLVELSLEGQLLRRIALNGFGDTEAIEYLAPNTYLITDERNQRLIKVKLDAHTTVLDAQHLQQLSLGLGLNGNKGFEGLAYDSHNKRIFVAKERDPVRIYEIRGFPYTDPGKPLSLDIQDNPARNASLFMRDLSSLQYESHSGHLLALSDESHLLVELDATGKPISSMSLVAFQHGLKKTIQQAEGVAMDDKGTLYLVSEPNLLYIFRKATH